MADEAAPYLHQYFELVKTTAAVALGDEMLFLMTEDGPKQYQETMENIQKQREAFDRAIIQTPRHKRQQCPRQR